MFHSCAIICFFLLLSVVVAARASSGQQSLKSVVDVEGRKTLLKIPSSALRRIVNLRAGSNVLHVSSSDEFKSILATSEGLVVVDFSAVWCGPCKLIAPIFDEMAKPDGDFPGVTFIKVDVDEVPELAELYGVQAMPTFLFIRSGKVVDKFSGASVEKLKETIRAHF